MKEEKRWYAIYTKPRWEKKVHHLFEQHGIESYCPLNKVRKQWSDRIKLVEEPLFKSYVFVHIVESQKTAVRMIDGVINYVYWLGKPAVVKDIEIERIQRFLNEYSNVLTEQLSLPPNTEVTIQSGALMDQNAKVLRDGKKRVEVVIESLGFRLIAFVDKKNIRLKGNN